MNQVSDINNQILLNLKYLFLLSRHHLGKPVQIKDFENKVFHKFFNLCKQ
jgi:hypothetical protein